MLLVGLLRCPMLDLNQRLHFYKWYPNLLDELGRMHQQLVRQLIAFEFDGPSIPTISAVANRIFLASRWFVVCNFHDNHLVSDGTRTRGRQPSFEDELSTN